MKNTKERSPSRNSLPGNSLFLGNGNVFRRSSRIRWSTLACLVLVLVCTSAVCFAQPAPPPPPPPAALGPSQLDQLVARIALYPDPLLAQVLTASTYWSEIPDAARWADEHSYLKGDALAQAIQADHLQWDPSILGLLAFPSVLDMMASDPYLDATAWRCSPDSESRRDGCRATDAPEGQRLRLSDTEQLL